MASKRWNKDPDATLDYTIDWSNWLVSGDQIIGVNYSTDPGLNIVSQDVANPYTTVWLAGGSTGSYNVTAHVTSLEGRQDDRTFIINVTQD